MSELARSRQVVFIGSKAAAVRRHEVKNEEIALKKKGTKLGVIMNGARTLLTGVAVGPSMLSVFETLGKEKSTLRLRSQIAWNAAHPPTA